MLTYDELLAHVRALPEPVVRELAEGPLPDLKPGDEGYELARDCRVCNALGPIAVDPKGKDMRLPYGLTEPHPAAVVIEEWHDCAVKSFDVVRMAVAGNLPNRLMHEVQDMVGALSYARCCAIYAAAAVVGDELDLLDVDVVFAGEGPNLSFVDVHVAGTSQGVAVGYWTTNDRYAALRLSVVKTSTPGGSSNAASSAPRASEEVRSKTTGGPEAPEGLRP